MCAFRILEKDERELGEQEHRLLLKQCYGFFSSPRRYFAPGQIIEWAPCMKNIHAEGPFVILEMLEEPYKPAQVGSNVPYDNELKDMRIGALMEIQSEHDVAVTEYSFCIFYVNSLRFRLCKRQ